jgi:hypothetical protein
LATLSLKLFLSLCPLHSASVLLQILYDDGETEALTLRHERVIWRMPPNEISDDGEDDVIPDDVTLDSDDSIDIMEAEETDDMVTDDDTPGSRKKGAKRIRRRLRTRKSRVGLARGWGKLYQGFNYVAARGPHCSDSSSSTG